MKRLLDIAAAGSALVVLSLVLVGVAILVRVNLGSPVLFRQVRPGMNGKPFEMIKFRTMLDAVDAHGNVLPDELRLTRFGRFLRSTSLDELPELWNVLKGDMSLVGPRPLLPRYLPYYTVRERLRHRLRPGITGLAQVNGRNAIGWNARLALDADYVEQFSFWRDLAILWQTVRVVLAREGISADGHVTMYALDEERQQQSSMNEPKDE